jgi:signal-transduction protein with cAMP-binding, CBS, and nucleotidyltransferase domain
MRRKTFEEGKLLYQMDTNSKHMYVIQSGLVEIVHKLDKGQEFVIERLYRHSVINHNSFILDDGIDTDAKCKTIVTAYYMDIETVKRLRRRFIELDKALTRVE